MMTLTMSCIRSVFKRFLMGSCDDIQNSKVYEL